MPARVASSSFSGIEMTIRKAEPGDLVALARLEESAFASDRLSRRSFLALSKSQTACLLVAREGEALAGYVLVLFRRGSHAARLYSLAVDSSKAGCGIGARLLAAAEAAAIDRGASALRLEVRADNPGAIRLYEGSGYRAIGTRASYYADGIAALRFERALAAGSGPAKPHLRAA
jgi:ribosomal protein S18 acetylase RimI-like enzyme